MEFVNQLPMHYPNYINSENMKDKDLNFGMDHWIKLSTLTAT